MVPILSASVRSFLIADCWTIPRMVSICLALALAGWVLAADSDKPQVQAASRPDAARPASQPTTQGAQVWLREPGEGREGGCIAFDGVYARRISQRQRERAGAGKEVAFLEGHTASILKAERTMLNLLAFLSGIATNARKFVSKAAPYGVKIMDTRKTLPLLRYLEKLRGMRISLRS